MVSMADNNIACEDGYTISTVIDGNGFHINPGSILSQFGSSGLLTDLRSASVNNDCYAQSAVKFGLHKHILHASQSIHKDIVATVQNFEQLLLETTFRWESETTFPKVTVTVSTKTFLCCHGNRFLSNSALLSSTTTANSMNSPKTISVFSLYFHLLSRGNSIFPGKVCSSSDSRPRALHPALLNRTHLKISLFLKLKGVLMDVYRLGDRQVFNVEKSASDEERMLILYFNRIGWPTSLPTSEKGSFMKSVLREKVYPIIISKDVADRMF
ncbi:unnamed protein product [Camellia sinensis]